MGNSVSILLKYQCRNPWLRSLYADFDTVYWYRIPYRYLGLCQKSILFNFNRFNESKLSRLKWLIKKNSSLVPLPDNQPLRNNFPSISNLYCYVIKIFGPVCNNFFFYHVVASGLSISEEKCGSRSRSRAGSGFWFAMFL
jgi:hypothetical protein